MSDIETKPKRPRGRPPVPIWDRLVSKIEIDGHPELAPDIPQLVGIPFSEWEDPFHSRWTWTGARASGKARHSYLPDHKGVPTLRRTHQVPYAIMKIEGKPARVQRVLYELLIKPIPEGHQLRSRTGDWWDINPSHWEPRKLNRPGEYPFKPSDFDDPTDALLAPPPISDELDNEEIASLAECIEAEYMVKPIRSYEDFIDRFDMMIDGLDDTQIEQLLTKAGLARRLLPDKPALL